MTANWTTPKSWTAGELTSSDLNALRDQLDWLRAAALLHGIDSASSLGRLRTARYGVSLSVASIGVDSATDKIVNWDTEEWDDDGFWTASPSPGKITIPTSGTYLVNAHGLFEADDRGAYRLMWLLVNGSDRHADDRVVPVGSSFRPSTSCTKYLELSAGDYLQVLARHNATTTAGADITLGLEAYVQVMLVAGG